MNPGCINAYMRERKDQKEAVEVHLLPDTADAEERRSWDEDFGRPASLLAGRHLSDFR